MLVMFRFPERTYREYNETIEFIYFPAYYQDLKYVEDMKIENNK